MKRGQIPTIEARIVDKVNDEMLEHQLAAWMIEHDIDVNRVCDYVREIEETRFTTTE